MAARLLMFVLRLRWPGPVDHTLPSTVDHTLWGYGQLRSFFEVDHTPVRTSLTLVDHTTGLFLSFWEVCDSTTFLSGSFLDNFVSDPVIRFKRKYMKTIQICSVYEALFEGPRTQPAKPN